MAITKLTKAGCRKLVTLYRRGRTLRECGERFGISMQRAYQIVKRDAPWEMRQPHAVPPRRNKGGPR